MACPPAAEARLPTLLPRRWPGVAALGVESERFLVGGHSWYIECFPCGEDTESAGWVSDFLCLDHDHGSNFKDGGEVFTAHRCVIAARSTVFMAELFGGPGKLQNTAITSHIRVDGMEPMVFKALLHIIYTDSFPEVEEGEGKVAMAQGLLAAADRYGLESLKLVCGDMLGSYIDEATAVTTLQLAHKHGCHRLKEACAKFLKDVLANVGQV